MIKRPSKPAIRLAKFFFKFNKHLFFAGVLSICSLGQAAPAPSSSLPGADDIASVLAAYFHPIKSIDYHYVRNEGKEKFSTTIHWMEKGDKLRYEWTQNKPFMSQYYAFDGKQYQEFDPGSNYLNLSKTKFRQFRGLLFADKFFVSPFEWVQPITLQNEDDLLSMSVLQAADCFAKILKSATNITKTTKFSDSVIEMTLPGGMDRFTKSPYTYNVYFSLDHNFYPIGWEQVGTDGKVLYNYYITEFGQITIDNKVVLYYPKRAERGWYYGGKKPLVVDTYEIKDITVNSLDDDAFTIDPSIARTIYDMDANKTIQVPQ